MHPPIKITITHVCSFKMAIAILALLLFYALNQAAAQGTYPMVEASFNVNSLSTNPAVLFNYAQTDIRVQILQPDKSTISLPAFYDGGTVWRVRLTPTQPGHYQITGITLNGSPLTVSNLQPASWTVTGFPTGAGFVRVDPTDPRRFITSNGRRYFPVGQDVAWGYTNNTGGNYRVAAIFAKMSAAHENWSRVWMTHFYDWQGLGLNLDWPKVNDTFGELNLTNAQHWDAIVAAADRYGIHFQMVLQYHGQYSSTNGSDVNPNWEQNPYNVANGGFLTNAADFFTNPTAIALTKQKYRYIIARWGYSPGIMAWELFNEVQYTDAAYSNEWTNIEAWVNGMATFIRAQDPYHHLITISSDLTKPIWDKTDYYQHHDYPSDLITGIRDAEDISSTQTVAPDFSGECGINFTPHVGVSPPVWAGLMAAQSGDAMPWYWDTIDADNDYSLIGAAADFVTVSGLADEDALTKSIPHVTGGAFGPLAFSPAGGWTTNTQDTFTVGASTPDGIGAAPSYLQGRYHHSMTPSGYTFLADYPRNGTFSVQVLQIASSGAGLEIFRDGNLQTNIAFPASTNGNTSTNFTASIPVAAGAHSITITNNGLDWILLGNITLDPYVPALGAYAIGTNNWQAVWIWNRTNVFAATPGPSVAGTVAIAGLDAGTYAGTWWDTFGAGTISNFTFTVTNDNTPVTLDTPPVLRSVALYVGIPAHAEIAVPNLTRTAVSNSASFNVPLVITNSGGLPLSYSLSSTNSFPTWLSFSSTNGYVPKSGAGTVYLAFNPAGLGAGTYHFTLFVSTSDPSLPTTPLPISFTITSGTPTVPRLEALAGSASQFVFQLLGDTNVPYVVQASTNLVTWMPVSTNLLPDGALNFTNPIPPGAPWQFWRALWQP